MLIKLTKAERETLLIFNEFEGMYEIETTIQSHIHKFDKLGYKCTKLRLRNNEAVC